MQNKTEIYRRNTVLFFLLCLVNLTGFAHSPDLSSLLIYEQNGKHFLAIKSSLTAFDGEVEYHFKKNAYKTPQEFEALVTKLLLQKCLLMVNHKPIELYHPVVKLGHETTVFAELLGIPKNISSIDITNKLFAEITNNQGVFILMLNRYPQKQFILTKENDYRAQLLLNNGNWTVNFPTKLPILFDLLPLGLLSIGVLMLLFFLFNKGKKEAFSRILTGK